MKRIATKLANIIRENNSSISELQYKKMIFGLECLLGEFSKTIIYLIIFYIMGYFLEALIAMLFFCSLRILAGGYHDNTYWQCFTTTLIIFILIVITGVKIELNITLRIILFICSALLLIVFAPVDHPNKPIISDKRRRNFKIASIITGTTYCCISFFLPEILGRVAILAVFAESLSLPFGIIKNKKIQQHASSG